MLDVSKDGKLPKGITRRDDGKLLAQVYSKRERRRISKVFGAKRIAEAKAWQRATRVGLDRGER